MTNLVNLDDALNAILFVANQHDGHYYGHRVITDKNEQKTLFVDIEFADVLSAATYANDAYSDMLVKTDFRDKVDSLHKPVVVITVRAIS